MNKKIIGFHGLAFSGKDTAALAIKSLEPNTDLFAFASPLKEACKILFNFTYEQLHDPIMKEKIDECWGKSPRQIMQWLGTDILRTHINQDFFVMNMKQKIESSKANYIVVSDIRFDNEAEFIKAMGGKVIKIIRSDAKTTDHSEHITEKGISSDLIDTIIENNGSIEEFQNTVKFVVKHFLFDDISNHSNHFTNE